MEELKIRIYIIVKKKGGKKFLINVNIRNVKIFWN